MFTVKHIDIDGTERLYAAETVEVVQGKSIFEDGIYLDWPPNNGSYEEGEASVRGAPKHVIQFAKARCAQDIPPRVFVMNREGSTVAAYSL